MLLQLPPPSYPQVYLEPYLEYNHFDMHHQDHGIPQQSMSSQGSSQIPIDPSLALYPPYYAYQQSQPQHLHVPQLALPPNLSSPSSQGSDTVSTPPTEKLPFPPHNHAGKRPPSSLVGSSGASDMGSKRARTDEEKIADSPSPEKEEPKPKTTRGSRACTVCRRLKMKCVGAEQGPPCKRCRNGNHECIFEESNRGKRSTNSNTRKHEALTRSLRKMERTLDNVLRSIGNPSIASGMLSRTPSPSPQTATTQALMQSPSPPPQTPYVPQASTSYSTGSPKLHSLPDNSLNPLGLLAEASLSNRRAQTSSTSAKKQSNAEEDKRIGIASDNYFKPGPMTILPLRRLYIERQVQPEMLSFVSTDDVVALFKIFFDHINVHCYLLDRDFHTPSLVCSRSPFLLTTICAIASKFYTRKPDLYPRLAELAKKLAFTVPAQGYKSLEIVQAYLLVSLWGCGAVERYEQDKTWMLLGMGIRMATDLNLHRKTAIISQDSPEGKARDKEVHNRERTWLLCHALDRSLSAQMGKPHSIKEDSIIRNASRWCRAQVAIPGDTMVAGYSDLQRIVSRSLEFLHSAINPPSGLQMDCDYLAVIKTMETQVISWQHEWTTVRPLLNATAELRGYAEVIFPFYYHYYMLLLNSFGLQNALERSPVDLGHFFARCYTSAAGVAKIARDELAPKGYLRYSTDTHFVFISYALLTLLKLIRPEFQHFLENEQKILNLVQDVTGVLESVAVDAHHTPALYATLLRALISARLDTPRDSSEASVASDADKAEGAHTQQETMASLSMAGENSGQSAHNEFYFEGEMGPVADISTFPPTMATMPPGEAANMLSMDNILSSGFWDSMLVPGYTDSMDGLSGGFVFGAGGSGVITPRWLMSPIPSGQNSPSRNASLMGDYAQQNMNTNFSGQTTVGNT